MNYGQHYGSLIKIKVENMREQHTALLDEPTMVPEQTNQPIEKQQYGIVTVAMGSGIKTLFESIGATESYRRWTNDESEYGGYCEGD